MQASSRLITLATKQALRSEQVQQNKALIVSTCPRHSLFVLQCSLWPSTLGMPDCCIVVSCAGGGAFTSSSACFRWNRLLNPSFACFRRDSCGIKWLNREGESALQTSDMLTNLAEKYALCLEGRETG